QSAWFANAQCVGLTAGASTPDSLMDEVEGAIVAMGRDVRSEEVKGEGRYSLGGDGDDGEAR
ncbi:MAG: hypothetical protein GY906_26840, partial [bacterium]|nr:hypothetical protein [bacterium]